MVLGLKQDTKRQEANVQDVQESVRVLQCESAEQKVQAYQQHIRNRNLDMQLEGHRAILARLRIRDISELLAGVEC